MSSSALPGAVLARLATQGATLGVAESLTGGLLVAALVAVPGASSVLRGGVVAYATDLKATLLDVDADLLERVGAVDPEVAVAMADGARTRLGATYGVATTGVAGPELQDGKAVGTVHVAVSGPSGSSVRTLALDGDRDAVRSAGVDAALRLLLEQSGPGAATSGLDPRTPDGPGEYG